MSDLSQAEDISPETQNLLAELAWEIEASQGEFKLIFARCNYVSWRSQLINSLQKICLVEIRLLVLPTTEKNLYAPIQKALGEGEIKALMVVGLETLVNLDLVLTTTNQVRGNFRQNFQFPVVWWITDEVWRKMLRLAPDLESWATTTLLAIAPTNLNNFLQEKAAQLFSNKLHLSRESCLELQQELAAAQKDLLNYPQLNQREVIANLESLLGFTNQTNNQIDAAIEHYQKGREFWRQEGYVKQEAKLLVYLTYCEYIKAFQQGDRHHSDWQSTKNYLQECIRFLIQNQRADLIAESLSILGKVLRYVADWDELQKLVEIALPIHETEHQQIALAQDYGFLSEIALYQFTMKIH